MSKYQRPSPKQNARQAAGNGKVNSINLNYNSCTYNGKMYSVDGLEMQPSAACQQKHKSLPATPRKFSGRATTRQQQRMQQQQQQMFIPQDAQPGKLYTAQSFQSQPQEQPQSLIHQQQLVQQQQLQLQHFEQLRQLHGSYWPFGGMANNMVNGQVATANPSPQFYNYGSIGYSNCDNFWPGYTMITPTDPNIRIVATD